MKKITLLITLLCFFNLQAKSLDSLPAGAVWVSNQKCCQNKPKRFRASSAPIKLGLAGLSGSATPSVANIIWLKKNLGKNKPVYLIDLRQETHLEANGLPISIYYKNNEINWGKNPSQIKASELLWSNTLSMEKSLVLYTMHKDKNDIKTPQNRYLVTLKEITTEEQAAKDTGFHYFRLTVPDHHPPAPSQVDDFMSFLNKLPAKAWLHFHCAAGKGRTTTFMVMTDILANAQTLSLGDIVQRQNSLGGSNLFASTATSPRWKVPYQTARQDFLVLFYKYVHSKAHLRQSFTAWMASQEESPYKSILKAKAYDNLTVNP